MTIKQRTHPSVSDTVYDYTMYHQGQYRHYISLSSLKLLIEQICELNKCPQYIRITPFYDHCKNNFGIEFDEYMCYIETTKKNITPSLKKSFYESCELSGKYGDLENQYNLVSEFDVAEFHASLWRYMKYLYCLIPKLGQDIIETHSLSETDLHLGEFCFEVHCE